MSSFLKPQKSVDIISSLENMDVYQRNNQNEEKIMKNYELDKDFDTKIRNYNFPEDLNEYNHETSNYDWCQKDNCVTIRIFKFSEINKDNIKFDDTSISSECISGIFYDKVSDLIIKENNGMEISFKTDKHWPILIIGGDTDPQSSYILAKVCKYNNDLNSYFYWLYRSVCGLYDDAYLDFYEYYFDAGESEKAIYWLIKMVLETKNPKVLEKIGEILYSSDLVSDPHLAENIFTYLISNHSDFDSYHLGVMHTSQITDFVSDYNLGIEYLKNSYLDTGNEDILEYLRVVKPDFDANSNLPKPSFSMGNSFDDGLKGKLKDRHICLTPNNKYIKSRLKKFNVNAIADLSPRTSTLRKELIEKNSVSFSDAQFEDLDDITESQNERNYSEEINDELVLSETFSTSCESIGMPASILTPPQSILPDSSLKITNESQLRELLQCKETTTHLKEDGADDILNNNENAELAILTKEREEMIKLEIEKTKQEYIAKEKARKEREAMINVELKEAIKKEKEKFKLEKEKLQKEEDKMISNSVRFFTNKNFQIIPRDPDESKSTLGSRRNNSIQRDNSDEGLIFKNLNEQCIIMKKFEQEERELLAKYRRAKKLINDDYIEDYMSLNSRADFKWPGLKTKMNEHILGYSSISPDFEESFNGHFLHRDLYKENMDYDCFRKGVDQGEYYTDISDIITSDDYRNTFGFRDKNVLKNEYRRYSPIKSDNHCTFERGGYHSSSICLDNMSYKYDTSLESIDDSPQIRTKDYGKSSIDYATFEISSQDKIKIGEVKESIEQLKTRIEKFKPKAMKAKKDRENLENLIQEMESTGNSIDDFTRGRIRDCQEIIDGYEDMLDELEEYKKDLAELEAVNSDGLPIVDRFPSPPGSGVCMSEVGSAHSSSFCSSPVSSDSECYGCLGSDKVFTSIESDSNKDKSDVSLVQNENVDVNHENNKFSPYILSESVFLSAPINKGNHILNISSKPLNLSILPKPEIDIDDDEKSTSEEPVVLRSILKTSSSSAPRDKKATLISPKIQTQSEVNALMKQAQLQRNRNVIDMEENECDEIKQLVSQNREQRTQELERKFEANRVASDIEGIKFQEGLQQMQNELRDKYLEHERNFIEVEREKDEIIDARIRAEAEEKARLSAQRIKNISERRACHKHEEEVLLSKVNALRSILKRGNSKSDSSSTKNVSISPIPSCKMVPRHNSLVNDSVCKTPRDKAAAILLATNALVNTALLKKSLPDRDI